LSSGHSLVASIASELLTPAAQKQVDWLLEGESMADISSWADKVIYEPGYPQYAWTRPLHYVDTQDCKYSDDRDCADGRCAIGAISQYY
jgi:hypothetical protein